MEWLMLLLVSLRFSTAKAPFSPNTGDQNAYGIKIAGNNDLFAQANSQARILLIQMAPYNTTDHNYQCLLPYPDPAQYVYTVGVGSKQNGSDSQFFYYAGEILPVESTDPYALANNGTFIAVMINPTAKSGDQCLYFSTENTEYLSTYDHQEFFVIAVEPYGQYAIGIATDFVFRYEPFPESNISSKPTDNVWPNSSIFHPCAADATETFTIVAGFVKNLAQSQTCATPTVHIVSHHDLTVLTSWSYASDENSWQSYLTDSDVDRWSSKLTMSVKINDDQPIRVLLGIPLLGTVFLFRVSNDGTNLSLVSSMSYNGSVGFGKSVAWVSSTQAAILYSAYSPDHSIWRWSKVYLYTWLNDTNLPSAPTAVIPNAQQPLPLMIDANFIRLVSTPSTLGILDQAGGIMLISSEAPGFFASTDITTSPGGTDMLVFSHAMPCISGTFKAEAGIHPCTLCPVGSRNPGGAATAACMKCTGDAFCPLGAVYEIERASLTSLSQAHPYPRSPELTVYEDLLINNMVTFGSTGHCRRISPMFWTVVLLMLVILMLLGMASLNLCVKEPRRDRWRSIIKRIFLRTDLVVSIRTPDVHRIHAIF